MIFQRSLSPFLSTFLVGVFGGVLGALLGTGIGYFVARTNDPSGWGNLPGALGGAIYGYGLGVGLAIFIRHARPNPPSAFSRAFLGSLSGLFFIIFFSAPLRLDIFPPLMWGLLIVLPPLVAARLSNPREMSTDEQQTT